MMKKNIASLITLTLASAAVLSGCSVIAKVPGYDLINGAEKYENVQAQITTPVETMSLNVIMTAEEAIKYAQDTGTYSDSEIRMLNLEYKLDNEGLSETEISELAALYEELGFIKCERDILELAYCMYGNEDFIEKLKVISINIAEEDDSIVTEINGLIKNLENSERFSEAIHSIESDEWFEAMMPKVNVGKRTYFRESDGVIDLCIEVAYTANGEPEITIRFMPNGAQDDTTGIIISRVADIIKVYKENSDGCDSVNDIGSSKGEKNFAQWTIDTTEGTVRTEEGTISDGLFTGAYKVTLSHSEGASSGEKESAFDLYNNCNNGFLVSEEYMGEFDEKGQTVLSEPSEKNVKAFAESLEAEAVLVYAYNSDKTKCLYKGVSKLEKEEGAVLGCADLKLPVEPEIQYYEIKDKNSYSIEGIVKIAMGTSGGTGASESDSEKTDDTTTYISESDLKVRIYNGEIQVYNGSSWISMGTAQEIAEADPFGNIKDTDKNTDGNEIYEEIKVVSNKPSTGIGSIKADTPTTSGGNKPASSSGNNQSSSNSQSSGQSSQPTVTTPPANNTPAPEQTPPAETTPTTPDPAPSNPEPSTPEPSDPGNGGGDSGASQDPPPSGDSDVEYSPDID